MKSITFINSCVVPDWLPEHKKEFRSNSNVYIEKIISGSALFEGGDVQVFYFQQGVGSVVAKITINNSDEYVIKTADTFNQIISEIKSYEALDDFGVKIPKIYESGEVEGYLFFIMEYFDQGTLLDKLNKGEISVEKLGLIKSETFIEIQNITGEGYGWPVGYKDGALKGNFSNLDDFLDEWFCRESFISTALEHNSSIDWKSELKERCEVLQKENTNNKSHLGTFDFQTAHFFATDPPTFFDGNFRLEPKYFAVAHSLIPLVDVTEEDLYMNKILLSEIEKKYGKIDRDSLKNAVWLQTFRKSMNFLIRPNETRKKRAVYMIEIISEDNKLSEYVNSFFE